MHNKQAIMQRTAAARNYFKQLQGDKYTRCWTDKNSNGVRSVKAECLYYNTKEEAVQAAATMQAATNLRVRAVKSSNSMYKSLRSYYVIRAYC